MSNRKSDCLQCGYAIQLSGKWFCRYRRDTGQRRPVGLDGSCRAYIETKRTETQPRKCTRKRRGGIWAAKAQELYDQGMTDAQIAEAVGVRPRTVADWRKENGLPCHNGPRKTSAPRAKAWDEKLARELYNQGLSDPQIAKAVGVHKQVIWNWRKANGMASKCGRGRSEPPARSV